MVWIKKIFRKIIDFFKYPYVKYQERKLIKKRLEEIQREDPYIYK